MRLPRRWQCGRRDRRAVHQRELLSRSVLDAAAQQVLADEASLDALAGDRQVRFADAPITWTLPVTGFVLTSLYGPRWGSVHTGLDMAVPSGTPIYAMAAGEIVSTGYEGNYGNRTVSGTRTAPRRGTATSRGSS